MHHLKNSLLTAGLLSLALTSTPPAGYAQTSNTIYGCVKNSTGMIRTVTGSAAIAKQSLVVARW